MLNIFATYYINGSDCNSEAMHIDTDDSFKGSHRWHLSGDATLWKFSSTTLGQVIGKIHISAVVCFKEAIVATYLSL